jgi:hypothetical protein
MVTERAGVDDDGRGECADDVGWGDALRQATVPHAAKLGATAHEIDDA